MLQFDNDNGSRVTINTLSWSNFGEQIIQLKSHIKSMGSLELVLLEHLIILQLGTQQMMQHLKLQAFSWKSDLKPRHLNTAALVRNLHSARDIIKMDTISSK